MKLLDRLSPWGRRFVALGLVLLIASGSFSAGIVTERYTQQRQAKQPSSQVPPEFQTEFANFVQVWQLVGREYYYGTPTGGQPDWGATRGLLSTLGDEHTVFLEPVQQQGVREHMSGDYEGIGVYLITEGDRWVVSAPIRGAPAEEVGVQARDTIVRVDGNTITGKPLEEVQKLLRGKVGTVVQITVERGPERTPIDFAITRATINIPSVQLQILDGSIALIRVSVFGDKTTAQLDAELKTAQAAGVKGVILDLRDNGGGWVQAAQEMLGRFIDPAKGPALLEDKTNGAQAKTLLFTPTPMPAVGAGTPTAVAPTPTYAVIRSANQKSDPIVGPGNGGTTFYDLPMVVLVNGGTASASEIVVGALQDYGRATIIGTTTFGKGSIQAVHEFSDGSSARITIAQWLTPQGRVIQKQGLRPDIVVENPSDGRDLQIVRAIAVLQQR